MSNLTKNDYKFIITEPYRHHTKYKRPLWRITFHTPNSVVVGFGDSYFNAYRDTLREVGRAHLEMFNTFHREVLIRSKPRNCEGLNLPKGTGAKIYEEILAKRDNRKPVTLKVVNA